MKKKSQSILLPCDCKCCMLVIEKTCWENGDVDYNISMQDSRYDHNHTTLWGRIKGAIKILCGKPVYYNDLSLEGEQTFQKLIQDMDALSQSTFHHP